MLIANERQIKYADVAIFKQRKRLQGLLAKEIVIENNASVLVRLFCLYLL